MTLAETTWWLELIGLFLVSSCSSGDQRIWWFSSDVKWQLSCMAWFTQHFWRQNGIILKGSWNCTLSVPRHQHHSPSNWKAGFRTLTSVKSIAGPTVDGMGKQRYPMDLLFAPFNACWEVVSGIGCGQVMACAFFITHLLLLSGLAWLALPRVGLLQFSREERKHRKCSCTHHSDLCWPMEIVQLLSPS